MANPHHSANSVVEKRTQSFDMLRTSPAWSETMPDRFAGHRLETRNPKIVDLEKPGFVKLRRGKKMQNEPNLHRHKTTGRVAQLILGLSILLYFRILLFHKFKTLL